MADDSRSGSTRLKPAPGSRHRKQAHRPRRGLRHRQDLAAAARRATARAPAASRRSASRAARCRSTCGMRKLRGPHMKKSMPFEPFRTHTQPVNLRDLEARFDDGADGHPADAEGERPGHAQRRAGQDPRPGRDLQEARPCPPTASPPPRARRSRPPAAPARSPRRTDGAERGRSRTDRRIVARSSTPSGSPRSGRSSRSRRDAAALPDRRVHPGAGHQRRRGRGHRRQLPGLERPRLPQPLLGRVAPALRDLRARDHALHHGLDHPAADAGGRALAREAPQGGRGRPAEDHAVHALPDRRSWPSSSRSATSSSSRASRRARATRSSTSFTFAASS